MSNKWIQATNVGKGKAWSLSAMLDIPEKNTIPKTLLRKIKNTKLGSRIKNPTQTGKQRIKVTKKLKQKALFAWNANY